MLAPLRMTDRKEWVSGRKSGVDCPSKRKQVLRFAQDDNPKKSGCQSSKNGNAMIAGGFRSKSKAAGEGARATQVFVPHRCPSHTGPDPHGLRPTHAHKDTGPSPGIASGPGLRFHQLVTDLVRRGGDVGGARRGGGHWANGGCVCTVTR